MGIKALILEDWPAEPGWSVMHLDLQGVRFDPADELVNLGVYDAAEALKNTLWEKGRHVHHRPGR